MMGAVLVRLGLPWHEALAEWLADPHAKVLGAAPEVLLPLLALGVLLVHPVTPSDQRGTYSVTNSAKVRAKSTHRCATRGAMRRVWRARPAARLTTCHPFPPCANPCLLQALGFAAAFALGSRARILETAAAPASLLAARAAFSACASSYHAVGGLLLMAATLAATHSARRAAVRGATRSMGLAGKVCACGIEYYLLGHLVALWVPRALDVGASFGHAAAHLVYH